MDWNKQLTLMVSRAAPLLNLSGDSFYRKKLVWKQRFVAKFGLSIQSAVDLWLIVAEPVLADKLTKVHFLWCLNFLKEYNTELSSSSTFKTSPTNWRDKIHFEDRFEGWNSMVPSCYVDGIDVLIQETRPFNKGLFSHKFKHAGLRYQVASAIGVSKFVHVSGGTNLLPKLRQGEKVGLPLLLSRSITETCH
ncbi:hypothetical protein BDR26DRAFT_881241 [Obelidium mucronatum]|nr:hypothetical protein BDR26DRAFT_881230 [Obelidium mucronatum]KAI9324486.1 hypothetical protein BDR26DRAFT_881241 [Obelidium mucronatum]